MIPDFKFCLAAGANDEYLPTRAENKATGYDVRAWIPHTIELEPGQKAIIPLGIRCFAPEGWWLALESRSSMFTKFDLITLDGVIDEQYEGSICFACKYLPQADRVKTPNLFIQPGQRIGQLIPVRREEMLVTKISEDEFQALCAARNGKRGAGGHGSTGL